MKKYNINSRYFVDLKLKKNKIHSPSMATSTHYEVGTKVRKVIEDIGETMLGDLPTPEKSIKQVERE